MHIFTTDYVHHLVAMQVNWPRFDQMIWPHWSFNDSLKTGVPGADIEDVILGDTNQAGEDSRNIARHAALLAGLPVTVPGQTINRLCASGLGAVIDSARAITCGEGDLYIAGGVESMSRAPFVMGKAESAFSREAKFMTPPLVPASQIKKLPRSLVGTPCLKQATMSRWNMV